MLVYSSFFYLPTARPWQLPRPLIKLYYYYRHFLQPVHCLALALPGLAPLAPLPVRLPYNIYFAATTAILLPARSKNHHGEWLRKSITLFARANTAAATAPTTGLIAVKTPTATSSPFLISFETFGIIRLTPAHRCRFA